MSTDVRDRLDELRDRANADSRSELLRRALAVYDMLVTNEINGGVAVLRGADGNESRLVFAEAVWAK
ncbi:ribbon-helix-helix protein, CopG family [Paraburkholderia sp. SIMBA_054]|uniref:ribbon-helix-helix protein, CopG family n=1 Tax=Paraburkholderia sp. SIMBA_054 TaxID=3085795 RepID=UPI00397C54AB